ncbi:MAG: hypothetical protein ACLUMK_02520 [Christensenellales bacterium]
MMRRQDDEPPDDNRRSRAAAEKSRRAARRRTISDSAQLYIERDDEFTRAPVDEHTPTMPSRRNSFTMQGGGKRLPLRDERRPANRRYAPRRDATADRRRKQRRLVRSVPTRRVIE